MTQATARRADEAGSVHEVDLAITGMTCASCSARIETGTSARSSTPSVRMPRDSSQSRSAAVTTLSTTSLTVQPKASLTVLKSRKSLGTPTKRRCGPISTLSGVGGAGFRPAQTISPTPSAASRAPATAVCGRETTRAARAASPRPVRAMPMTPEAARSAAEGGMSGPGWGRGEAGA